MKNIKTIVAIAITLISIFGNTIFGYAGTTQPVDSTPAIEVVTEGTQNSGNESFDSRASVSDAPATLQYIVKFRSADAANAIDQINNINQDTAQATISQISGKTARIDGALSGQAFLVTFADQAQVDLLLSHTQVSEPTKLASATTAHAFELEYMVPNLRRDITLTPDDTYFEDQIQYDAPISNTFGTNLKSAWNIMTGSTQIVIAVLDTGIRYEHPDLAGRLLPGYDFVSLADMGNDGDGRDADPSDPGGLDHPSRIFADGWQLLQLHSSQQSLARHPRGRHHRCTGQQPVWRGRCQLGEQNSAGAGDGQVRRLRWRHH